MAYLPSPVSVESLSETQPLCTPRCATLLFDGRLDNREELFSCLRDLTPVQQDFSDAALVMAAYEWLGQKFATHLKGDFALAIYDGCTRSLLLTRDLIGMRPLYYCRLTNIFLFASEAKAILAHPGVSRRIDDEGLAHVLLPGRAVQRELTPFQGIRGIIPGQMGIATTNDWNITQVSDFDATRTVPCKDAAEYVEAFELLFRQSVQRRLRSAFPVGISVSGGLDSSGIFCMAQHLRTSHCAVPTIAATTMGFPAGSAGDEEPFLAVLEREYGAQIERVPWEPGNLRRPQAFVWHTELPQHHPLWNWQQSILERNRRSRARIVLTGFFGDQVLNANAYLADLLRSLRWGKLLHHLRTNSRSTEVDLRQVVTHFLLDLVKSSIPRSVFPAVRSLKLRIGAAHYPLWYSKSFRQRAAERGRGPTIAACSKHAEEYYQQLRSVDFLLRLEQTNKMYAMYGLDTATPFLDMDLLAFLMAIPGEVVNWEGVPKGLYRRSVAYILPQSIRDRTSKGDSTHFVNEAIRYEYAEMRSFFGPDCLASQLGYLDQEVLQRQLAQLERNFPLSDDSAIDSWNVGYLLGLELWLRAFFGGDTDANAGPYPTVLEKDPLAENAQSALADGTNC
jgi:asparagine synthase (glutamine-hydrolysing)